ncbi:hypothetical protein ACH47B_06725 [Rhodococcus sp. NPDC019627]|uniref:hypothetical protein n=1 Tax=unclassified Rhodococcus (in: high G+C Gram-positive bacteria) TaxID=192944 RepID=UPI00379C2CC3
MTNQRWDAFAKDAAEWVDQAGAGLLELMRRHGMKDPGGPVSDHYPFIVLEGVVGGFEAAGFVLDEVAEHDVDASEAFGPLVNWFGVRAAVDTDQAPASGPIVNGYGLANAAGDPWPLPLMLPAIGRALDAVERADRDEAAGLGPGPGTPAAMAIQATRAFVDAVRLVVQ